MHVSHLYVCASTLISQAKQREKQNRFRPFRYTLSKALARQCTNKLPKARVL
jgi:hypothetical protein